MPRRCPRLYAQIAALGVAAAAMAGCGTTGTEILNQPATIAQNSATLVTNSIAAIGAVEIPKVDADPVGEPVELYTRVARGATNCWFGANGPLKSTHIFNAVAEPGAKGGSAEIIIHERDPKLPDPRGNRAFRVQIIPEGDTARVESENIRFPIEVGQRMQSEVRRWARDDLSCTPPPEQAVAAAALPPVAAPATPAKKKPKKIVTTDRTVKP